MFLKKDDEDGSILVYLNLLELVSEDLCFKGPTSTVSKGLGEKTACSGFQAEGGGSLAVSMSYCSGCRISWVLGSLLHGVLICGV